MSVPAYMLTVKNVPGVFGAVRDAGVPDRFTHIIGLSLVPRCVRLD